MATPSDEMNTKLTWLRFEEGDDTWDTDQSDDDPDTIGPSNKYFYDAKFYVGSTNDITEAT